MALIFIANMSGDSILLYQCSTIQNISNYIVQQKKKIKPQVSVKS